MDTNEWIKYLQAVFQCCFQGKVESIYLNMTSDIGKEFLPLISF